MYCTHQRLNIKVAGKNVEWLVDFRIYQVDKKVHFHPGTAAPPWLLWLWIPLSGQKGSCSLLVCPYRAIQLRLLGRPSHLRRNWLMFQSKPSTVPIGTWYINNGHKILCRMPCYAMLCYDISMPWTSKEGLTGPLLIARFSALCALTGSLLCLSEWHQRFSPGFSPASLKSIPVLSLHSPLPQEQGPAFGWLEYHSRPCYQPF